MKITLPGWPGHFDIDINYEPPGPDGWMEPGDSARLELELIVWEFSPHDSLVLEPGECGDELHHALYEAAWAEIAKNPYDYYPDFEDNYL